MEVSLFYFCLIFLRCEKNFENSIFPNWNSWAYTLKKSMKFYSAFHQLLSPLDFVCLIHFELNLKFIWNLLLVRAFGLLINFWGCWNSNTFSYSCLQGKCELRGDFQEGPLQQKSKRVLRKLWTRAWWSLHFAFCFIRLEISWPIFSLNPLEFVNYKKILIKSFFKSRNSTHSSPINNWRKTVECSQKESFANVKYSSFFE